METGPLDIALDFGLLVPIASELGVLFGVPIRLHVAEVLAIDVGMLINVDNIGGDGRIITSIGIRRWSQRGG